MAYFHDLSPYAYGHDSHPGVLHVGWLDGVHEFPKGSVPAALVAKMKRMAEAPTELYRGYHVCELCVAPESVKNSGVNEWWEWAKLRASNGEIRVNVGDQIYAAPVLITHYIEEHGYLPPSAFLKAIEESAIKQ